MGLHLEPEERVLVRMPSWLGDFVMAEPALGALISELGEQRVSIAAPAHLLPLLDAHYPGARRLPHAGRGGERPRDWRGHAAALFFTNSFRSAWVAWRAGIPQRVGWARDLRGWLLSDAPVPALERGAAPLGIGRVGRGRRYLPRPFGATCQELLGRFGIGVSRSAPRLVASEAGRELARERLGQLGLDEGEEFVLASVGSRPGSAKALPSASWARALDRCAELDREARGRVRPLLLLVGPGEERCAREVQAGSQHPRSISIVEPIAGLPELLALAELARVALVADGGPRHVIAATGTPLAWVAGPSDPRHTADHLERQRLLRVELSCGPCHRERCPLSGEHQHACMNELDPQRLAELALGVERV